MLKVEKNEKIKHVLVNKYSAKLLLCNHAIKKVN